MPSKWSGICLLALTATCAPMTLPQVMLAQVQSSSAISVGGPEQPIAFSHRKHAGALQLSCEFCHTPSRSGETLVIPRAAACMQCHQTIATASPEVEKLAGYAKTDAAIPWVRVYQLPSFVNFSHRVHTEHGNTCAECHGQVAQQDRIAKEADISMAGCVNCHREKKAALACDTCHTLSN